MKLFFFSILMAFCSYGVAFSQIKTSKIVGAYQWCPFHCETIKLNKDFTFDFFLEGDLYGEQRNKGVWKFVEKDKIQVKTFATPLSLEITEKVQGESDKIKIQTLDQAGALFPNIEIIADGKKYSTNENGVCLIPKSDEFKVSYANQNSSYRLKDLNSNELEVIIGDINFAETEGYFIIKKNEICRIGDNPNDLTCFRKLKKATELKLFSSNPK